MPGSSTCSSHPLLYQLVFVLDAWLRRWHAVTEYSADPRCIFRIQVAQCDRDITLADGTSARAGDPAVDLHIWNEQMPRMPSQGPSLTWARHVCRCVEISLRELARYLRAHPELRDVAVVRGNIVFCVAEQSDQMVRVCRRFGFEMVDCGGPDTLGAYIHRLGQNVLVSLMVLALNGVAIRPSSLRRVRLQAYLSRKVLISQFGNSPLLDRAAAN